MASPSKSVEEEEEEGKKEKFLQRTVERDLKSIEHIIHKLKYINELHAQKIYEHVWRAEKELKLIRDAMYLESKFRTIVVFDVDGTLTPPSSSRETSLRGYAVRGLSTETRKAVYSNRGELLTDEESETLVLNVKKYIEENLSAVDVAHLQELFKKAFELSNPFPLYILSRNSLLITHAYLLFIVRGVTTLPPIEKLFDFKTSRFRHHMRVETDDKGYHLLKIIEAIVEEYALTTDYCCLRIIFFDDSMSNLRDAHRESLTFPPGYYFIPFYLPAYEPESDALWLGKNLAYKEAIRVIKNVPFGTQPISQFQSRPRDTPPFEWTRRTFSEAEYHPEDPYLHRHHRRSFVIQSSAFDGDME